MRRIPAALVVALLAGLGLAACEQQEEPVTIGLITKQEENPYWVTIREVAQQTAKAEDVTLRTATGTSDVDLASQERAVREMVAEGVDGILITPVNSTELLPAIAAARDAGVIVIALDTPTDPVEAVDAYYTTDNVRAGELIGTYAAARAQELGLKPQVAMLDLAPGISTGTQRHEGFLEGFGISEDSPELVAASDVQGDQQLARTAMTQILGDHPGVNVVYTVNEPAALGALEALQDAGIEMAGVVLVSIDGGCRTMTEGVRPGLIDATSQQYPENMAREGVRSIAAAVRGGPRPSGYLDTGVELVTGSPVPGVSSRDVEFGIRNCWGD